MTGNDLRNRRIALDMSQAELAEAIICTQPQISLWERRNEQPLPRPRSAWLDFHLSHLEARRAADTVPA